MVGNSLMSSVVAFFLLFQIKKIKKTKKIIIGGRINCTICSYITYDKKIFILFFGYEKMSHCVAYVNLVDLL